MTLRAGEAGTLELPIDRAELSPANSYPFGFEFSSSAGNASYSESLSAAVVPRGAKQIDGKLDDWADVPGITVIGSGDKMDISEQLRRPWIEVQEDHPQATTGELKVGLGRRLSLPWRARERSERMRRPAFRFLGTGREFYFHSAASDSISPYKEFIEEYRKKTGDPQRSFAEVPFVYRRSSNT